MRCMHFSGRKEKQFESVDWWDWPGIRKPYIVKKLLQANSSLLLPKRSFAATKLRVVLVLSLPRVSSYPHYRVRLLTKPLCVDTSSIHNSSRLAVDTFHTLLLETTALSATYYAVRYNAFTNSSSFFAFPRIRSSFSWQWIGPNSSYGVDGMGTIPLQCRLWKRPRELYQVIKLLEIIYHWYAWGIGLKSPVANKRYRYVMCSSDVDVETSVACMRPAFLTGTGSDSKFQFMQIRLVLIARLERWT